MGLEWKAECFLLGPVRVSVETLVRCTGLLLAAQTGDERRKRRKKRKVPVGLEAATLDENGTSPSDPCLRI